MEIIASRALSVVCRVGNKTLDGPVAAMATMAVMDAEHPLKAWRDREGLNQSRAAVLLGLKKPTLNRYEKGTRTPSLTQAAKLSEQTGIPIDKFVRQTEAAQ